MSEVQIITIFSIVVYFIIMIAIGLLASRNQSHDGFVIGSRNVGYIPTIGSLSTSFRDGMGVIFLFGFGAATGYGVLWLIVGVILGMFVYSAIGPKVRKISADAGYVTIGELLRARFGIITERASSLIVIIFALMMIATQLYVAGHLFATILDIEAWIGIASIAFVVGFYLFFGGYSTVVKTDAVQFFLIVSLIAIPIFFAPPRDVILNISSINSLGFQSSLGLLLIGFLFVLSGAETWQRVFSARNDNVIKRGFPLAGIFLIIMTLSIIFLGMASAPFMPDNIGANNAFFEIFKGDFISPALQAFIAVVVIAICMSTLDTFSYLVAATLGKNFMPDRVTKDRNHYIMFSRVAMILTLISMSVLALTISDVIIFVFDAASLLFILAPIYLAAALGYPKNKNRHGDAAVTISMILSVIIYLYMFTSGTFENILMISAPAGFSFIFTLGAILYSKKNHA